MSAYIRRLVSGNKARFKDSNLNLELDLVYVTDQVIVMGYPANGIEGFYRNRREDAQKFLSHRHGKDFWVFNFCPVRENSYPASVFDGRVSRYPFPDHHAPPLALLPLAVREMHAWLDGHPEKIIVLHCKAGKGRSGTLACAYLLSLEESPTPPRLQRSYSTKQWAKIRADKLMQAMPDDDTTGDLENTKQTVLEAEKKAPENKTYDTDQTGLLKPPTFEGQDLGALRSDTPSSTSSTTLSSQVSITSSFTDPLKNVLDLHTSRRMKNSPDSKLKHGVSIPSQRRWLYYWSLILTHQAPAGFWPLQPMSSTLRPKVRLTQIKIRMKEISGIKMQLVKVANVVIDNTNMGKSGGSGKSDDVGHIWVSLARYDDKFVEKLESWECYTRDENGDMGRRKPGSEQAEGEDLTQLFTDKRWDKNKMVRCFARMGTVGQSSFEQQNTEKEGKLLSYTLLPLSNEKWARIREKVEQVAPPKVPADSNVESETTSITDATQALNADNGIIVDACREVRVKLYMGQVFMGWIWFIPMFHMPQASNGITRLLLTRKEVDFPLGVGSGIIDVEISFEACEETDTVQPPPRQTTEELHEHDEPAGIAATLQATQAGGVGEVVEAKQAAED